MLRMDVGVFYLLLGLSGFSILLIAMTWFQGWLERREEDRWRQRWAEEYERILDERNGGVE